MFESALIMVERELHREDQACLLLDRAKLKPGCVYVVPTMCSDPRASHGDKQSI